MRKIERLHQSFSLTMDLHIHVLYSIQYQAMYIFAVCMLIVTNANEKGREHNRLDSIYPLNEYTLTRI